MATRAPAACLLLLLLSGCDETTRDPQQTGGGSAECGDNELTLADGSCFLIGVPPNECAVGFEPSDDGGCMPILPDEACADGMIAVPGDTVCRPLAECGSGTWGDIPLEATTTYVAAGSSGNGSAVAPFGTIAEAIAAAPAGGQIAIAEGSYDEHVLVSGKPLRLWGRCPELVAITGPPDFVVDVLDGASGSELHNIGVTGLGIAISVSGAENVLIDSVWVHDTGHYGIDVENTLGPASATLRNVLIERATTVGLLAADGIVVAEGIAVRHTRENALGVTGRGASVQNMQGEHPFFMTGSMFSDNSEAGAAIVAGPARFEGCVFQDTRPQSATSLAGRGISTTDSLLEVYRSLLRRNADAGIFVGDGSHAIVRWSVMSDGQSSPLSMRHGMGIAVQNAGADIADSLITRNRDFGVTNIDSAVTLTRSIVRDTLPADDGLFGDGLVAAFAAVQPSFAIGDCIIETASRAGVASFGASVAMLGTRLECNPLHLSGEEERGVASAFDDRGGNRCGCGAERVDCTVQSVGLAPPSAIE